MPRSLEELAAVRRGIRLQWMQPQAPPFPGDPDLEDTTDETLLLLARQRLIGSRLLAALRSGNPDAINESRPGPGGLPPRGLGRFFSFHGESSVGGTQTQKTWGPFPFPYIIREVGVTGHNQGAAGSTGAVRVQLLLVDSQIDTDNTAVQGARIWPQQIAPGSNAGLLAVGGQQTNTIVVHPNVIVLETGRFLSAHLTLVSAVVTTGSISVTLEEIGAAGLGNYYAPPPGRSNLNPSTQPPVPRLATPQHPRGAVVRVTQGGRILSERRISWEALDASLRAKWFNQQVGEPPDPSLIWIQ